MSSRCPRIYAWFIALAVAFTTPFGRAEEAPRVLRVAADPNNLPFSNERGEGFENKIVQLIARKLHATVSYTWWAQRRGFFRNTLKSGLCDLVPGVPRGFEMALATAPYYRSSYVFVTRRDRGLRVASLDDPALRQLRIGVQMIGNDFYNTPPAHALSRRGLIDNIRGFTVYGDYAQRNPPTRIVDAVIAGEVDVALVWGPQAGFVAREHPGVLELTPLPASDPASSMQFAFEICMGVRRDDRGLRDEIDAVLVRRRHEINAILADYGVPRTDLPTEGAARL